MNQEQEPMELVESLGYTYECIKALIDNKANQLKLEAVELISVLISEIATIIILGSTLVLSSIFAFVALAFYLSDVLSSYVAGFGLVAGIILLLSGLLLVFRQRIITNPIIEFFIRKLYK
jgi:hypothetical protein